MQETLRGFVKDLETNISRNQLSIAVKLAKGQCPNMEEYKREVGRSEGMGLALIIAKDMIKKLESASDDNELPEMEIVQ